MVAVEDAGLPFDACVRHYQLSELVDLVDRCPDDILVSFGKAMGMLITEAPTGTLEYEPEVVPATA